MINTPQHEHDCQSCFFLGRFGEYDLYFCKQGGERPTVIARWGRKGDYMSGLCFGESDKDEISSPLGEAYRRAKKLNYI